MRFYHQITQAILVGCFVLFAVSANAQQKFNSSTFNEIASRAESVLLTGQASSEALEELRVTLSGARSRALEAQTERGSRVKTINEQIAALGVEPEDPSTEPVEIAARRKELNEQLSVVRGPLVTAQEAYERADGLISEIDDTIRARKSADLVKRETSPLSPIAWGQAATALKNYGSRIKAEVSSALGTPSTVVAFKEKLPLVLILGAIGLVLLFPITRWTTRKMAQLAAREKTVARSIKQLVLSLMVFVVPVVGFTLMVEGIISLDIVGLRGMLLLSALPKISIAVFGSLWLARNLFNTSGTAHELMDLNQRRLEGTFRLTLVMGYVLALNFLVDALAESNEFSPINIGVFRFPLILLGGYTLVMMGRKIQGYRARMIADETASPMADRCTQILTYLCFLAGVLGPVAASFGYFNIGVMLVISTIMTLGVMAAFYILYTLIAAFVEDASPVTLEDGTEVQSTGAGLFRVFLAFACACLSLPLLALVWGARVTDLQGVWLMLSEGVKLGDTRLSFSDLLTFAMVFAIGFTITRLLQSGLRTAVLPKTKIDLGAQNALVTGLGYVGIFLAAMAAINSTGLDLSSLAIVAGALSVGIGFGLQNIVSNFVSGIILLIERPIRLGDWIEVAGISGNVSKISVRSTTIETFDQSEVIVPNADFISGVVTNMTHNSKRGRVKVPVGVAYDSDPVQVKEILLSVANDNPMVLKLPAPQVHLLRFGADSIDFEIRGILRDVGNIVSAHSDMNFEILHRFKEAGIEIPFGQREIRIKNADEFAKALQPQKSKKT